MTVDSHEPMTVAIVNDDSGSHVEPPLDQEWDHLTTLRWHAGVVGARTGIRIRITTNCLWQNDLLGRSRPVKDHYGIEVGYASYVAYPFHEAWVFLVGMEAGHEAAQRQVAAA